MKSYQKPSLEVVMFDVSDRLTGEFNEDFGGQYSEGIEEWD